MGRKPMTTTKQPSILFSTAHNEELAPNEPELAHLIKLLEANGMIPVTQKTPISEEELSKAHVIVLGNPLDSLLQKQEIKAIMSFVESGGGLLLMSGGTIFGKGGDVARNTNLNELAVHFGFRFADRALEQSTDTPEELFTAVPAGKHPALVGIDQVYLTSGVSLLAEDTNIHLLRVVNVPGTPTIAIATEKKEGRVIGLGGGAFFFNHYIDANNHEEFIVQLFRWLAGAPTESPVQKLSTSLSTLEESTTRAIADLRQQLDKIEEELAGLKEVINTSVKEMEKLVRQFKEETKES
ncbi:MAG: DUF4350 domain-containing protein [Candidatus Thorarchaeota archaeon]